MNSDNDYSLAKKLTVGVSIATALIGSIYLGHQAYKQIRTPKKMLINRPHEVHTYNIENELSTRNKTIKYLREWNREIVENLSYSFHTDSIFQSKAESKYESNSMLVLMEKLKNQSIEVKVHNLCAVIIEQMLQFDEKKCFINMDPELIFPQEYFPKNYDKLTFNEAEQHELKKMFEKISPDLEKEIVKLHQEVLEVEYQGESNEKTLNKSTMNKSTMNKSTMNKSTVNESKVNESKVKQTIPIENETMLNNLRSDEKFLSFAKAFEYDIPQNLLDKIIPKTEIKTYDQTIFDLEETLSIALSKIIRELNYFDSSLIICIKLNNLYSSKHDMESLDLFCDKKLNEYNEIIMNTLYELERIYPYIQYIL
jgi:hypothetical protein